MYNFYPYHVYEQTPEYLCLKLKAGYRAAWFFVFRILPWIIAALSILSFYHLLMDGQYVLVHVFYLLAVMVICGYLFTRKYPLEIVFEKGKLSIENQVYYSRSTEPYFFYLSDKISIHKISGRNACWVFSLLTDNKKIFLFSVPLTFYANAKEVKNSFIGILSDVCKVNVTDTTD